MEHLIFSLNATLPVFFLMILGILFKKTGWITEDFASQMNKFVFLVPLPVLVFKDLCQIDFKAAWKPDFVLFCFIATLLSILIAFGFSYLFKDPSTKGEFIQTSYRSSAALLGVALIQNIYGHAGMAPLMLIGSVPLYNMMAVILLTLFHPAQTSFDRSAFQKTVKGILTNPIIIAIALGLLWSALQIPMPGILSKTITNLSNMATPMGLIAMGATLDFTKAFEKWKPAFLAVFLKLIGLAAIFLPLAVLFGFRKEELIAILVMLGSATTVSSFVMAKNMGHDGTLSSSVVMLTTLLSAFTLTLWLYILRTLALI